MSKAITLKPHQVDAVWRCMTGGATRCWPMRRGRQNEMCRRRHEDEAGRADQEAMYVVPNHMLEQFAREFMQLYPTPRCWSPPRRISPRRNARLLTAKIATGDWDGIIVTHSSFERIGMSKEFQERFLREQIKEYEACWSTRRRTAGTSSRRSRSRRRPRGELKDLLAEGKKDDGLVFDELGIDQIFIDEFQTSIQNLETCRPRWIGWPESIPAAASGRSTSS